MSTQEKHGLISNQLSADHCPNVVVLPCTAKTQRMRSLMGTLARTGLTSTIPVILTEVDPRHL